LLGGTELQNKIKLQNMNPVDDLSMIFLTIEKILVEKKGLIHVTIFIHPVVVFVSLQKEKRTLCTAIAFAVCCLVCPMRKN
jgi:hypothetical protein